MVKTAVFWGFKITYLIDFMIHVKSEWQENPEISTVVFPIRLPRSVKKKIFFY